MKTRSSILHIFISALIVEFLSCTAEFDSDRKRTEMLGNGTVRCECNPQHPTDDNCIRLLISLAASIKPPRLSMISTCSALVENASNLYDITLTAESILFESKGDIRSAGRSYAKSAARFPRHNLSVY